MRTHLAVAALALTLLGAAAGCDGETDGDPGSVASEPSTTRPSESGPTPTEAAAPEPEPSTPPFPANTKPDDGGHGTGGQRWVTGVRTARHDGYDRVVFDLDGGGTAGWYVSYTDDPRADGSGDPVPVEGQVFLQVVLRGMGYPGFDGIPEIDLGATPGAGTRGVTEVVPAGVFEGDQLAFIGLTGGRRPFRVFGLTDPVRVVVDVRDE